MKILKKVGEIFQQNFCQVFLLTVLFMMNTFSVIQYMHAFFIQHIYIPIKKSPIIIVCYFADRIMFQLIKHK